MNQQVVLTLFAKYLQIKRLFFSKVFDKVTSQRYLSNHCLKSVRIWSFRDMEYLSVFSPDAGKYGHLHSE